MLVLMMMEPDWLVCLFAHLTRTQTTFKGLVAPVADPCRLSDSEWINFPSLLNSNITSPDLFKILTCTFHVSQ